MMTKVVEISRPHKLTYGAAMRRVEEIAAALASEFKLAWHREASSIHFRGSGPTAGVKGFILVQTSAVRLRIELPIILMAFEPIVRSKAAEYLQLLDRQLGSAS